MNKSFFLTHAVVQRAAKAIEQSLLYMLDNALIETSDFHLIVLNPSFDFSHRKRMGPNDIPVEGAILFEKSWGNVDEWQYDYKGIARSKALTAMRHKMSTSKLKESSSVLQFQKGDMNLAGGVYKDGLVVAGSGSEFDFFDEMIAENLSAYIIGFANQAKNLYFADMEPVVTDVTLELHEEFIGELLLDMPIKKLMENEKMTVHLHNLLSAAGIHSLRQLERVPTMRGFGVKAKVELKSLFLNNKLDFPG